MNDFHKCKCPHCGQSVEYPTEGMGESVPCPTCENFFMLLPDYNSISKIAVVSAPAQEPFEQRRIGTPLAKLTEETIRTKTKTGDTPLHRAAKKGQFEEIPSHLFRVELFMVTNNSGYTPLHVAARNKHLDQVPRQFLTKETLLTTASYFNRSVNVIRNNTVLHDAAYFCAEQIPKEFLTPEFLRSDAGGYGHTVLHALADAGRLDLVPEIYSCSEMWNLRDSQGLTPRDIPKRKAEAAAAKAERDAWRPPRISMPVQNDPSKLLPVFTDERLRAIEVKSKDRSKTYFVNLLDYTCTCSLCLDIHLGVPLRDFGRLCKHIIIALREKNLVAKLPPIAKGIAENGLPYDAFGVYPGRFAEDIYGRPIYITGKNYDGWINVFALTRRNGVNYFRYGFNVKSNSCCRIMGSGAYDRTTPPIDESLLY